MRRISLTTLLVGINVSLLTLLGAGLTWSAVLLLHNVAATQGQERVAQTVRIAQHAVQTQADHVASSAQLLAERPTLLRLLVADDRLGLHEFLLQFSASSDLGAAAIWRNGQLIATSDASIFALPPPAAPIQTLASHPLLVASAPVSGTAALVAVWQPLEGAFVSELSATLGLETRIISAPASELVWAPGTVQVAQWPDAYVAVAPLGQPVQALVEVRLPTAPLAASVRQLIGTLLLGAGLASLLALLINLLMGRRVGTPLRQLTQAAARIGRGDLATPVAPAAGAEIATLAQTLEDMRRQLSQSTADLRSQQAEASAILSGIVEGVFSVDRERRISYLNPQAAALLGIEVADALGHFCGDVLRPLSQNGVLPCAQSCPIIQARFSGHTRATEHLRLPDGSIRTVVITSAAMNGNSAQVQVLRDETDQETTRRLRDTILATISHEFRTPLSAQQASLELLQDQLPDLSLDQIAQLLVSLQRGTLRLTQLIDNLLESARIEAGQLGLRMRALAIDVVVDEALELMQPLIDQRTQTVERRLPYPMPLVCGDAPRLIQVLVNLLANASKFAPEGSCITIGVVAAATTLTVWVDDQGPGIALGMQGALFSRFVRARSEEPEQPGVGLGLWIVQSIVERHGGRVTALTLPGGTRVAVTLPLAEQPNENFSR